MDPNYQQPGQQPAQGTPQQANPYGFILESPNKKRMNPLKPNNSSTTSRLLFVVGGLFLFIIIAAIFSSLLSSGSKKTNQQLTGLVAEQQEIVRVADLGIKGSSNPAVVAYAETTKLTVQSQQNKLIAYMVKKKIKATPAILGARKNTKTDAILSAATASNSFDQVFASTIKAQLNAYAQGTNSNATTSTTGKAMFNDFYLNTTPLLK